MVYSFYNMKLKTAGASILHTPRGKHENEIMKSGDGQPFNEQMIAAEVVPDTLDEKFETSPGFDVAWDLTFGNLSPDTDPSVAGTPSGWGNECCLIQYEGLLAKSLTPMPIAYTKVELVFDNLPSPVAQSNALFSASDVLGGGNLYSVGIVVDSGEYKFRLYLYEPVVSPISYYSDAIVEDTRYIVEVKWDQTNNLWEWRIGGITQDSGALSTNTKVLDYHSFGVTAGSDFCDIYFDRIGINSDGWIGAGI